MRRGGHPRSSRSLTAAAVIAVLLALAVGGCGSAGRSTTAAQPYQRLERTQIEDAQQFGTQRLEALPTPVSALGIAAYWFPTERKVMATEGRRLISVFVAGPGIGPRRVRAEAIAVARDYLGPDDLKAADPNTS